MIELFLESHLVVQIAFVVGTLVVVFLAGLLVWAWWWPVEDETDEYGADDLPPCMKEHFHE